MGTQPSHDLGAIGGIIDREVVDAAGMGVGAVDAAFLHPDGSIAYVGVAPNASDETLVVVPIIGVPIDDSGERLRVPYAKGDLRDAPRIRREKDPTLAVERDVAEYYGRTPRWRSVMACQTTPAPTPEITAADEEAVRRGLPELAGDATIRGSRALRRAASRPGGARDPAARVGSRSRRRGQLVVAPPSIHRSGRRYRWILSPERRDTGHRSGVAYLSFEAVAVSVLTLALTSPKVRRPAAVVSTKSKVTGAPGGRLCP